MAEVDQVSHPCEVHHDPQTHGSVSPVTDETDFGLLALDQLVIVADRIIVAMVIQQN